MKTHAVVFGCEGITLTDWERNFFSEIQPLGIILFSRNIETPKQLNTLISQLKEAICSEVMIFTDQEGGRVQRLRPPYWSSFLPAAIFGKLYKKNREVGKRAVYLNARLLADELYEAGFTVNCAPVLDIFHPCADAIIGDRAFSSDPEVVSILARNFSQGLIDGHILPVIKHIPGHGRAEADSHKTLPQIKTPLAELQKTDFIPFYALRDLPIAMTAHILYEAVDSDCPATLSKKVIHKIIRKMLAYEGVIISDDICMKALKGSFEQRSRDVFSAGCDLIMHCSGESKEMEETIKSVPILSGKSLVRVEKALSCLDKSYKVIERSLLEKELKELLKTARIEQCV